MATTRQTTFQGGEYSPSLWNRVDWERYGAGLRRCRNFFISQHGSAMSRPGTHYIEACKISNKKARLIPFVYSDTDAILMEFGEFYIRFYKNGEPIKKAGTTYEIVTPYAASSLPYLKYVQVGNVLTIAHPNHVPKELYRKADDEWTLTDALFTPREHLFRLSGSTYWFPALSGVMAEHLSGDLKRWRYKVTQVFVVNGVEVESKPYDIVYTYSNDPPVGGRTLAPTAINLTTDTAPIKVWVPVFGSGDIRARIYRGKGDMFGFVGEVKTVPPLDTANGVFFYDRGNDPDYTQPPPTGRKPFKNTNYPAVVGMYEQRMLYGNFVLDEPDRIRASAVDSWWDFDRRLEDQHVPNTADGSVELKLATTTAEEIRALVGMDRLLVFTNSSIWSVEGSGGDPLAATTLPAVRVQSTIGSSWVSPLVIDNRVLWVRTKGQGVRDLHYDWRIRSYTGSDLSSNAQHLFQEHSIVEWAYAEDPYGVVWAVRSDGVLLSLSYGAGGAWAWHDTPGGTVESVCCIPEGDEDAVYLIVQRGTSSFPKRYVERMASRRITDVRDGMRLDCGRTQVDFVAPGGTRPATITVTRLAHLNGQQVWAVCDGRVIGPLTVTGGAVTLTTPPPAPGGDSVLGYSIKTHVGLRFDAELETLDVPQAREKKKIVKKVIVELDSSSGMLVGEAFDNNMVDTKPKTVASGYGPNELVTGIIEVNIRSTWNRGGRVAIRQVDPLPVTVLGVTREGEVGD